MVLPKKRSHESWMRLLNPNRNVSSSTFLRSTTFLGNQHSWKRFVAFFGVILFIVHQIQIASVDLIYMPEDGGGRTPSERPTSQLKPSTKKNNNTIVAWKGPAQGNVVSRNTTAKHKLSDFFPAETKSTYKNSNETIDDVMQGREQILSILNDAGIVVDNPSEMRRLPRWQQVTELYGPRPVILGLDQCRSFQDRVPPQNRFLGVAGNFNSGTTAFGISLQANCRFPHHNDTMSRHFSNEKVSNVNGMLNQVPWAKHKMAFNKYNHTILSTVPKDHVLPVVLVRDPLYWMQSMCKEGYGVRWDHDSQKHCPNLIPDEFDKKRFGKRLARTNVTSVRVWMGANPTVGPSWDSLVHYWNAWYESYVDATWPRLLIRFEDTLFHPKQVMEEVCLCGGGELVKPFQYLVDEAKWNHKQEQNNMVTAMMRYGTARGRYRNMTKDDIAFSNRILNSTLLEVFQYKAPAVHS